jgi:hypothetical protein
MSVIELDYDFHQLKIKNSKNTKVIFLEKHISLLEKMSATFDWKLSKKLVHVLAIMLLITDRTRSKFQNFVHNSLSSTTYQKISQFWDITVKKKFKK